MTSPEPWTTDLTERWLGRVYGNLERGWLSIFALNRTTGEKHTEWAPATDRAGAAQIIRRLADDCCVWIGVATRANNTGSRRGGAAECDQLAALTVDIDVASEVHTAEKLPATFEEALGVARRFPLPPSALVNTGGGYQAWYVLTEPLGDGAGELLAQWGATWAEIGTAAGVHIDNTFDLPRVMRVPGTLNTKFDPPAPVELIESDWGATYERDELEPHLIDPPAPPDVGGRIPYIGPDRPGDAFNAVRSGGEVLASVGFHTPQRSGAEEHWVRPGKDARGGHSATVHADGYTTIWSDAVIAAWPSINTRTPYDPFGLYARIFHDGDFTRASDDLETRGYGTKPMAADTSWVRDVNAEVAKAGDEWEHEPIPLDGTHDLPTFPVDTLPDWAANAVVEVAERLQVPVDLTATLALGALAAAATRHVRVHVTPTWSEHVNLYLTVAMPPGSGKSPAYGQIVGPLHDYELELREMMRKEVLAANNTRDVLEKRLANARNNAAKADDYLAALDQVQRASDALADHEEVVEPRLIADDATPEALEELLGRQNGAISILSTEGDVFDLMTGRYGDRANLGVYLKGWSGDSVKVDRVGRDGSDIAEALLNICVTIQPATLRAMADHAELVGRGLSARFMYSVPPSNIGGRDRRSIVTAAEEGSVARWGSKLIEIARSGRSMVNGVDLELTADALERFLAWDDHLETQLRHDGSLNTLAEWSSKLRSSIVRVAGLLAWGDGRRSVELDDLERGIAIGEYWTAHAVAAHDLMGADSDLADARFIVELAVAKSWSTFSRRDVYADARRRFPKAADVDPGLGILTERGHIRQVVEEAGHGNAGPRFELHPAVIHRNDQNGVVSARVARLRERHKKDHLLTVLTDSRECGTQRATRAENAPVDNSTTERRPSSRLLDDDPEGTDDQ